MFTKPNATHVIAVDLEGSTLKAAQLSYNQGKPKLQQLFEIESDTQQGDELNANSFYSTPEGKILQQQLQSDLVVTVLNSVEVLVRSLDIKLKKERDIDAVLAFQAEPLLPYPVENAILDRMVIGKTQEGTQLTLLAARKDHIQEHLDKWRSLEIDPEVVSCVPAALTQFSQQFSGSSNPHFIVNLGRVQTTCVLVYQGRLIATQSVQTGINSLFQAFEKDNASEANWDQFSRFDFSQISQKDNPLLHGAIENLRLELTRIIYALSKQYKGEEVREVFLTGEGAPLLNLRQILFQALQKDILEFAENPRFPVPISQLQKFAIQIGAALSALPGTKEQINFRQQELAYPKPWRRLQKPLLIYFTACCVLAFSIYFLGEAYTGYKEDQLRQGYVDLLATLNKPYQAFEKEYSSKHPLESQLGDGVIPITLLSQEDITNRLMVLQKELKESPDSFPLLPNTPRVSDVLAWLSTHPNIIGKDKSTLAGSPLQIDSFSYTMVKRPEQKKPQEKYQVKVEIEFSSPTPKLAREFHDALIAPNDFVDPKGEVKWSSNKGKYRTSFFLKDKTAYPSSLPSGA